MDMATVGSKKFHDVKAMKTERGWGAWLHGNETYMNRYCNARAKPLVVQTSGQAFSETQDEILRCKRNEFAFKAGKTQVVKIFAILKMGQQSAVAAVKGELTLYSWGYGRRSNEGAFTISRPAPGNAVNPPVGIGLAWNVFETCSATQDSMFSIRISFKIGSTTFSLWKKVGSRKVYSFGGDVYAPES